MSLLITKDIKSITDLKRNTGSVMSQVQKTRRPVVLTVNGKAEAVLMDAKEYEKMNSAFKLLKLLVSAEEDIREGRYKEAKLFFRDFRSDKKI
jgi:prevent-host-death family protein